MILNAKQVKLTLGRKVINALRSIIGMKAIKATVEELNSDDLFAYAEKIQIEFGKRADLQRQAVADRKQEGVDLKKELEARIKELDEEGKILDECAERTDRVAKRYEDFHQ